MLTEDQTRRLLAEAARTITPGPEPEVSLPSRRPIVPIAVAAAIVLVIAALGVVLGHRGSAPSPSAPATAMPGPTPTADPYPGDPGFHLAPDQIPPVAGYPTAVAQRILEQHGWTVSERGEPGCAAGTASATWPPAGTPTTPGTIVVLTVSTGRLRPDAACDRTSANSDPFLLWVEGLGPAPRLVSGTRYVDAAAGVNTFLLPSAAPYLDRWPHLSDLATAATTTDVRRTSTGLTFVPRAVSLGPGEQGCTACETRTITVRSGDRVLMTLTYHLTSDASIDAVTLDDRRTPTPGAPPDVVGDSAPYATLRLRAWGYAVTPIYRTDCAPAGVVSRITVEGRTARIGVAQSTGACVGRSAAPAS